MMMQYYYSATLNGFFTDASTNVPSDAEPISEELHATLLAGLNAGKVVVVTASGLELQDAPIAAPSPPTVNDLLAYSASKRFAVETKGIVLNGAWLNTSRESQAMISNAAAFVKADGGASVDFKADSGWVDLDATSVVAAALAIGRHVQACFTLERLLDGEIRAGTITDTAQIDAAAWPGA